MERPRVSNLMYPYENTPLLREHTRGRGFTRLLIRDAVRQASTVLEHINNNRSLETKVGLHKTYNGSLGAEILQDKRSFAGLVQKLGYQAPSSILVSKDTRVDTLLLSIASLDANDKRRFCKPLGGSQGRGVNVATSPEKALDFVQRQDVPYLIQNFLPPQEDWRYILHRDRQQLEKGEDQQWRIAYKKVRPSVVGDGESTLRQLILQAKEVPQYAKRKYLRKHRGDAIINEIPEAQKTIELTDSGNISQGAYGQLPNHIELEHMDRFMLVFQREVEREIGGKFGVLCVDIGIKDRRVFDQPYNFEEMRKTIIFYEFQVPFSFSGYLKSLPDQRKGLRLPDFFYRRAHKALVLKSLLLTGAFAQKSK